MEYNSMYNAEHMHFIMHYGRNRILNIPATDC